MEGIAIVVLAAGNSSRMNSPKQLLQWGEQTFIAHAVAMAHQISNRVFCVLGANRDKIAKSIPNNVTLIFNSDWRKGMSQSIVCIIEYIMQNESIIDSIMILLVDQPTIELRDLTEMKNLAAINPNKIIASAYEGRSGVPAIFPRKYFDELLKLKGDRGAQQLLAKYSSELINYKHTNQIVDIDTLVEYEALLKTKD